MKRTSQFRSRSGLLAAPVLMLCAIEPAVAFNVDLNNPDMSMRVDTTVRYNLGFRAEDCDKNICGNDAGAGDVTAYQSDRKFSEKGDIVTNRLDLLTEVDFVYKGRHGARVSGTAWYDHAYRGKPEDDAALDASGVGKGASTASGDYNGYTKRWNHGPSGEFLDAFLFTGFDIGDVPVDFKYGQHTIYWGESMFSPVNGVSYNQSVVDIRKSLMTPGTEAKELFKPLEQLSVSAQVHPDLTIAAQYFMDWKPNVLPDGGTYLGAADGVTVGGGVTGTVFGAPFRTSGKPDDSRGDWGVAARWSPVWLQGTLGLYYREYTNKFPQLVMTDLMIIPGVGAAPAGFGLEYSATKREKLYGISLSRQVGGIAFGADLTYRPDAVLTATPFGTYVPSGSDPDNWVPRGDLYSGVVNAMMLFKKNAVFDMASLVAEVNYSYLDKVTENAHNFNGKGFNCSDDSNAERIACQTRDAVGASILFAPTWFQVMPGIDISAPMFIDYGIKGNSPVLFGANRGQGSWSVGVAADIYQRHNIALKYNGFIARHSQDELGAGGRSNAALGKYWDRGWVSLTAKTSF